MSASLIGRLGSSAFRLSTTTVSMSLAGSCFSSESAPSPSIMGVEDGVEQSFPRPCHLTNGGSKRTCELTSSIVPRGTSFHRLVELECSPIVIDPVRPSCRYDLPASGTRCRRPICGAWATATTSLVQRNSVPSTHMRCMGHDRLLHPAAPGDLHRPSLEPGPFFRMHHALSGFVEHDPHHLIAAARYSAAPIDLAGLILGARQSKHGTNCLGFAEPSRHVDSGAIGQCHHWTDARGRYQATAHFIVPNDGQQAAMQDDELLAKRPPDDQQRFDQHGQVGHVLDQLFDFGPRTSPSRPFRP